MRSTSFSRVNVVLEAMASSTRASTASCFVSIWSISALSLCLRVILTTAAHCPKAWARTRSEIRTTARSTSARCRCLALTRSFHALIA